MKLLRKTTVDNDFTGLTAELDAELNARYGRKQAAYNGHNRIDPSDTAYIAYIDGQPVGCGCFKALDETTLEIKRMFVKKAFRRQGLSKAILNALEILGVAQGYTEAMLETGKGQPEAINLYRNCGYHITANYGPYIHMENSICMKKILCSAPSFPV